MIKHSNRYVNNVLVLFDFFNGLIQAVYIAGELDVNHACLASLEYDVLQLLHVPLVLCKHCEDMSKDPHLVIVANDYFVEKLPVKLAVNAVFVVNGTRCGELLNYADSFLTDSGL